MRTVLIVAASLLLLAAVADARFAEQLREFKLRTEMKLAKLATGRGFNPQQSSSDLLELLKPASDDPVCAEAGFSALVISSLTPCQASTLPLLNQTLSPTVDAHRAAWTAFCGGACANQIKTSLIGSKYWICLQPVLRYFAGQVNYLCSNRDSNDDLCGLAVSRLGFTSACGAAQTSTLCGQIGSGTCAWAGTHCTVNPTQTLLTALCGTCLTGLNKNVLSQYPQIDSASDLIEGSQQLCSTAPSGAYCLPLLATQLATGGTDMFESNTLMASFCESDDMVACFGGYVAHSAAQTVEYARDGFVSCAKFYDNVSSSVTQQCLPRFLQAVGGAQAMSAVVGAMCTNFNGTYCIPAFYALESVTEGASGCPSNAQAFVSRLGCCLGTAQSLGNLMETLSTDPSLIPPIPGYTPPLIQHTAPPAPATQNPVVIGSGEEMNPNPGNGGLFALAACGVTGLNESLRVRCAQNRFKVSKNLLVKLDYAAVTATPEKKAAFVLSLRRDVARNAKVSESQITDDSISATNRVQVTTSGRGMQVQATASGVQYSYTLQAGNRAQAQAASENVDDAVNNGYLDMTNTQATVETQCTACVGSGGVSSVNQVSSTTVGNTVIDGGNGGTSSGAAAVGTLLAIILTTLALLC